MVWVYVCLLAWLTGIQFIWIWFWYCVCLDGRNFKKETQIWNLKSVGGILPFHIFSGKLVEVQSAVVGRELSRLVQVRSRAITFHLFYHRPPPLRGHPVNILNIQHPTPVRPTSHNLTPSESFISYFELLWSSGWSAGKLFSI